MRLLLLQRFYRGHNRLWLSLESVLEREWLRCCWRTISIKVVQIKVKDIKWLVRGGGGAAEILGACDSGGAGRRSRR